MEGARDRESSHPRGLQARLSILLNIWHLRCEAACPQGNEDAINLFISVGSTSYTGNYPGNVDGTATGTAFGSNDDGSTDPSTGAYGNSASYSSSYLDFIFHNLNKSIST